MANKRTVQAFLAASALFLAMSGMNAWAQDASAPAASVQTSAAATAPVASQSNACAGKPGHHDSFKAVDTNGDGQVLRDEAEGHAWLKKNFDQIDTNHDGQLNKGELAAQHKARKGEMHEKMVQRFGTKFKAAGKDNDDSLTKDEVQANMPHLAESFDQADASHDGKITEDGIRVYMKARHDAHKAQKSAPATTAIPDDPSATKGE